MLDVACGTGTLACAAANIVGKTGAVVGLDPNEEMLDVARGKNASIESLVSTERACAWTLGGILDDDQFDRLTNAAEESLQPLLADDGNLVITMPALIATARKN